jgi:FMN phosphatase YigB (HAD superfamily)
MGMVKGLAFDLYGTQVHLERDAYHLETVQSYLGRATGIHVDISNPQSRPDIVNMMLTEDLSPRSMMQRLMNLPEDALSEFDVSVREAVDSVALFNDTLPTLLEAERRGIPMVVVSNLATPYAAVLARHGLNRFFPPERQVLSFQAHTVKPGKAIFEIAAQRLNLPLDEILFVGDNPRLDYEGPLAAGMQAVLLDRTGRFANSGYNVIGTLLGLMNYL